MKITFGKIFEMGLVSATKSAEELRPFLDWVQTALDNCARALVQNITVTDNLDAQVLPIEARSTSTSYTGTIKFRKKPSMVVVVKQFPTTPMINSFAWENGDSNNISVTIVFQTAPTSGVNVSLLAFFN